MEAYATRKTWSKPGKLGPTIADQLNRHKGFFARRRTIILGTANPGWITEASHNQLFTRLDAEVAVVEAFLTATLTAITGGTDGPPAHLDLADLAKVKNTTPAARVRQRKAVYLARRKKRIPTIVWRALALHPDLWDPPGAGAPTLRTAALKQVLDQRLRMTERLNLQISSAQALVEKSEKAENRGMKTDNHPQGPWLDGFRVRMFEYPRILAYLESVVGAGNIAEWNGPLGAPRDWKWEDKRHRRMHWQRAADGHIRMAPPVNPDWGGAPSYERDLRPAAGGASDALARLFTPADDWWSRSWLFCDHVISSLQIEGLWFALKRRTGNDTAFNNLPGPNTPSYVRLTYAFSGDTLLDRGFLLNDVANDPYFEKTHVLEEDLQVGDHLILWNNFLYGMISNGEWRLENALVMDIDGDPLNGTFTRSALKLQGHGTGERAYAPYQATIAAEAQDGMTHVQSSIADAVAANAAVTEVNLQRGAKAVRWDPYEAFASPGAWWIRIPVPDPGPAEIRWNTVTEALHALPKSVADQAATAGPGYHAPPLGALAEAVYFPIFEPLMPIPRGETKNPGWPAYFAARRTGPSNSLPKKLQKVVIDGSMCPGLFFKGAGTQIAVMRPRIKP